jgi:hypothetical protein
MVGSSQSSRWGMEHSVFPSKNLFYTLNPQLSMTPFPMLMDFD